MEHEASLSIKYISLEGSKVSRWDPSLLSREHPEKGTANYMYEEDKYEYSVDAF